MQNFRLPILPESSRALIESVSTHRRHPGLQLDKFSGPGNMRAQRCALSAVCKTTGDDAMLGELRQRREAVFRSVGATTLSMSTRGPLTLHLARSGALENAGIALHPVYGFAVLPGSGLKGMTRAWAETVWAPAQHDAESAWREIETVFGWSPRSEEHKGAWRDSSVERPPGASAGRVVFHDAWPRKWPRLITDIVNNHNAKYYAGDDDAGDWHDPVPVYFLAIAAGEVFDFALSARDRDDEESVERARTWLVQALEWEGVGAKTAAGYGRFATVEPDTGLVPASDSTAPPEGVLSLVRELRLAAPAFLAGAEQEEGDCDLRPASLRGLLRWWWRTMHAGVVDRDTLRELEAAVWGDVSSGGAVRISLDPGATGTAEQHPDKPGGNFLAAHDIDAVQRKSQVTQGLYYASYGMAEGLSHRWYRPSGAVWRLTVTVRRGRYRGNDSERSGVAIEPELILEQASCALWLLARFGGAGSRSRKGFGSFCDLDIDGLSSTEDCLQAGARFREVCGIPQCTSARIDTPSLDDVVIGEWATPWLDPWFVLEQTGTILQLFAKGREGKDRIPLGLPRRTGKDRSELKAGGVKRHASPALWSLSHSGDWKTHSGDWKITVRLIAFPASRLPDRNTSKGVLEELLNFADNEITNRKKELALKGQKPPQVPAESQTDTGSGPGTGGAADPEQGTIVEAVLLDEKTKKGKWTARHEPSGKVSPINNSEDVPPDKRPGDRVNLYVFSSDAFRWPTPDLRQKDEERRQGESRQRGGPGRRPRGRR